MSRAPSAYLVQLIQDACLKSFWYKRALKAFLRRHHIAESALASLSGETKRDFLYQLFDHLAARTDAKAQSLLLSMARSLAAQTAFPDLKNVEDSALKIDEAKEAVRLLAAELKKHDADENADAQKATRRQEAEERRAAKIRRTQTLDSFRTTFETDLAPKLGTQPGGYAFEKWFYDLAQFFEIDCRRPYKDPDGRQIDGAITIEGTTFLVELKFQATQADATDIDSLKAKVDAKADNTMGIMLAISGYSSVATAGASGRRTTLMLLDHAHLYHVLSGAMRLEELVLRVKRHAAQTGQAYLPVSEFGK